MKIIAKTDCGVLLQATDEELANLIGFYSKFESSFREVCKIGNEIQISKMYQKLYKMKEHEKELESASKQLQLIAENIKLISPIIINSTQEEQSND